MWAGAHERDILDGLLARDKADNAAQQPAKWTSERDMLGKRVPQALFLSLISPPDGPP
jgi:hypothetical protein